MQPVEEIDSNTLVSALKGVKQMAVNGTLTHRKECEFDLTVRELEVFGPYHPVREAVFTWYCEAVRSWPQFSGCPECPVPESQQPVVDPRSAFLEHQNSGTLWQEEQLEMRLSLLDHLIRLAVRQRDTMTPCEGLTVKLLAHGMIKLRRLALDDAVNTPVGICGNLDDLITQIPPWDTPRMVRAVGMMAEGWEFYSGNKDYPIPAGFGVRGDPGGVYRRGVTNNTLWQGDQKLLRVSLLEHMIRLLGERKQEGKIYG